MKLKRINERKGLKRCKRNKRSLDFLATDEIYPEEVQTFLDLFIENRYNPKDFEDMGVMVEDNSQCLKNASSMIFKSFGIFRGSMS